MRPLLVLLLVIAAVTAFLLTQNLGGGPKGTASIPVEDTSQPERPRPPAVEEDPLDLPVDEQTRSEAATALTDDPAVSASSASGVTNALFGLVVNEGKEPVAKTQVTLTRAGRTNLFGPDPEHERARDKNTVTNEKGEYRFENVEPWNSYALVFSHPDYKLLEEGSVNVRASGDHPQPPVVMRPGVQLEGFVRDTLGSPIAGAKLALGMFVLGAKDEKDPNTLRTTSDDAGHYAFRHVERGTYALSVSADGFGSMAIQNLRITNDALVQQDIVLDVASMIGGRIVSVTGEGVPGAEISAFALNQAQGKQSRSQVKSDAKGDFRLEDISQGTYTLHVMANGFEPKREPRVETGTMDLILQLPPLPTISGHVLDSATSAPIQRFTVQLRQVIPNADPPDSIPEPQTKMEVKNANGEYTLACTRPGPYEVEAIAPGYSGCFSAQVTVSKGQNIVDVDVFMLPGGSIRGRIVDAQRNPIAGATITTHDHEWTDDLFTQALGDQMPAKATVRSAKSKEDGTFEVPNLTPTQYLLDVQHPQYSRAFHGGLHVAEGKQTDAGDGVMIRGGTVEGTVYSPEGQPLAGGVVQLVAEADPMGTPRNYTEKTDAQGHYLISGVYPGIYRISAQRNAQGDLDPFEVTVDRKDTSDKVQIVDGEPVIKDFHLGVSGGGK